MKRIRGGKVETTKYRQDLIDDNIDDTVDVLADVTIYNIGDEEINIIINGGDEIPLDVNEGLCFGDLKVYSLIVVEQGSKIKFMGIN